MDAGPARAARRTGTAGGGRHIGDRAHGQARVRAARGRDRRRRARRIGRAPADRPEGLRRRRRQGSSSARSAVRGARRRARRRCVAARLPGLETIDEADRFELAQAVLALNVSAGLPDDVLVDAALFGLPCIGSPPRSRSPSSGRTLQLTIHCTAVALAASCSPTRDARGARSSAPARRASPCTRRTSGRRRASYVRGTHFSR